MRLNQATCVTIDAVAKKNIRCFPTCSGEGHKSSGFCGRTVHLELGLATLAALSEEPALPLSTKVPHPSGVMLVAEFLQEQTNGAYTEETSGTSKPLVVGMRVTKDFLERNTRVKEDPLRRFIAGNATTLQAGISKKNACAPVYGFRPTCWHYAWRSNKHCTNKRHCMRVYVFKPCGAGDEFTCVEVVDSPLFSLFSSKQLDNYANDGIVPSGAMALFNAKRNRLSQAKAGNSCTSKAVGSKRQRSPSSEEEKTSDKAKSPKAKLSKTKFVKKRRLMSPLALAKRAIELTESSSESKMSSETEEQYPFDAMIADCLGITNTGKEEPVGQWSPKSVFFDVHDLPTDLLSDFGTTDSSEPFLAFDEEVPFDDSMNVLSWDFPLMA